MLGSLPPNVNPPRESDNSNRTIVGSLLGALTAIFIVLFVAHIIKQRRRQRNHMLLLSADTYEIDEIPPMHLPEPVLTVDGEVYQPQLIRTQRSSGTEVTVWSLGSMRSTVPRPLRRQGSVNTLPEYPPPPYEATIGQTVTHNVVITQDLSQPLASNQVAMGVVPAQPNVLPSDIAAQETPCPPVASPTCLH